jgi:hypothetical protein
MVSAVFSCIQEKISAGFTTGYLPLNTGLVAHAASFTRLLNGQVKSAEILEWSNWSRRQCQCICLCLCQCLSVSFYGVGNQSQNHSSALVTLFFPHNASGPTVSALSAGSGSRRIAAFSSHALVSSKVRAVLRCKWRCRYKYR